MKTGKKYQTLTPLQARIEELQAKRKKINSWLSSRPLVDDKFSDPDNLKDMQKVLDTQLNYPDMLRSRAVAMLKAINKELNHYYLTTRGI